MKSAGVLAIVVAIVFSFAMAAIPTPVEARAGRSSSMGSRGTRTYTAPAPPAGGTLGAAKPIERSVTPPPSTMAAPPPAAMTAPAMAPSRPGLFGSHPFVSGLMGGLIGAGIGSMLFGGHFFGEGAGGFLGVVVQILLLVLVVRLAVGYFRRRSAPGGFQVITPQPMLTSASAGPASRAASPVEFELTQADLAEIQRLLDGIQGAWSEGDVGLLHRLATSEMAGYFEGQLAEDRQRGVQNRVEAVQLLKGDVNETWHEGALQYATVSMQWRALDYTLRRDNGAVVDGDRQRPTDSAEVWTVVRQPGGAWQLSAIQQLQLLN